MKNVLTGEIYLFGGVYHLVLLEDTSLTRKMFWCSLDREGNIDNLLMVDDYGIVTPNENWQYVDKVTNVDYEKALVNFRNNITDQYQSGSIGFTRMPQ